MKKFKYTLAAIMLAITLPSTPANADFMRAEDQDNGEDSIVADEIPELFGLHDLDALAEFDGYMEERMAQSGELFMLIGGAPKLVINVNKKKQTMTVTLDGKVKYKDWKVSTGRAGNETRGGTFTPFQMDKNYFSRRFKVILPFGIKFDGGNLIHAASKGGIQWLGQKRSAGCVRLLPANAAKLYTLVAQVGMKNTRVVVQ